MTRPLADVIESSGKGALFSDGDWVESKDQDPGGEVRLTQLADVGDGCWLNKSARFMTSAKAKELKCTFLRPGDILVARMPDPLGRACIFPGDVRPCVTVVDVCVIRLGDDVDRRWLMYQTNSPSFRRQLGRFINGTTRQRVSRTNLGQVGVDAPALPEQRRIADILDKADAIRRKRKEAIALTEELLQSAFLEMFGDPVTNPKGWPMCVVEDLCSDIVDCPHTTPTYVGTPLVYPCVRTSDLQNGFFAWSTTRYVAAEEYRSRIARLRPEPGDVLYTREGERFGIAAVVPSGVEPCLGQRMMLLRADGSVARPAFLWGVMNSASVYRQAAAAVGGSTSPHVNVKTIRQFRAVRPPLSLQGQYENVYRRTLQIRTSQQQGLGEASRLFDALVQRAFQGELASSNRVNTLPRPVSERGAQ